MQVEQLGHSQCGSDPRGKSLDAASMHQHDRQQDDRLDAHELRSAGPVRQREGSLCAEHPCVGVFSLVGGGDVGAVGRKEEAARKNLGQGMA